jgi:hypothetical protein
MASRGELTPGLRSTGYRGRLLAARASPMKRPYFENEIGRDGKVKVGGRFSDPSTLNINQKMAEIERGKTSLMEVTIENQWKCNGRSRGNECAGKSLKIRLTESRRNIEKNPRRLTDIGIGNLVLPILTVHQMANRSYKGINIRPTTHRCIE